MNTEDLFRVEFSEDTVGVEFSEDFLSLSREEQIEALQAFRSKRMLEPFSTQDVSKEAAKGEIAMILAETLLTKLKRGERIEKGSTIDISLDELMTTGDMDDSDILRDMARHSED
jgi:hypothetical protein